MNYLVAVILTLAAPLVLLPIEQLFSYSYLLEEIFKVGVIFFFFHTANKFTKLSLVKIGMLGLIFTFSESVLYLVNFLILENFSAIGPRLLWTGILHTLTFIIIYVLGRTSKIGLLLGLIAASLIHVFFNEWLVVNVLTRI